MDEKSKYEKLYYELAILINEELYKENLINPSLYKQTESRLIKELNQ